MEKYDWILNENACTDFSCNNNKQGICSKNLTYKGKIKGKCENYKEMKGDNE